MPPVARDDSVPEILEHAEVCFREVEHAFERRVARLVAAPRAELAVDVDFARRHTVGERRLERPRLRRTQIAHVQVVNRPDLWCFVPLEGQDEQAGVARVRAIDDDAAVLQQVIVRFPI